MIGKCRWCPLTHEWDEALSLVPSCLDFISAWVLVILHDTFIRDSLVDGRCRRLRQALVDKATWWRSVIFSLSGHMFGLAVTSRGDGQSEASRSRSRIDQLLLHWHGHSISDSVADIELMDAILGSDQQAKAAKFLQLQSDNPSQAQACLSAMLSPRLPLQFAIKEAATGRVLQDEDIIQQLDADMLSRSHQAETGYDEFNSEVSNLVLEYRKQARLETASEPQFMISRGEVDEYVDKILKSKASLRFPRAVLSCSSSHVKTLTWALLNLFFALGLVPTSWLREVSPVRKRGPAVVNN